MSTIQLPTVHKGFNPQQDLVDMKGKVVIVTGGNRGMGLATVRHLLRAKTARVYLAARNEERANEAIKSLNAEGLGVAGSGSEVIWLKLDLSDPREAKRSAEVFMENESRLDVLINNAGSVYPSNDFIGQDGISNMHILNFISPYVFTRTLLPLLQKTGSTPDADVRIVDIADKGHEYVPSSVVFKTVEDFNVTSNISLFSSFYRYGSAKLAVILWSRYLQNDLLPSENLPNGITVISLHPGVVDTLSARAPGVVRGLVGTVMSLFAVMPEVGSLTALFAAASRQVRDERERYQADGGTYMIECPSPGTRQELHGWVKETERGADVVKTTEELLERLGV